MFTVLPLWPRASCRRWPAVRWAESRGWAETLRGWRWLWRRRSWSSTHGHDAEVRGARPRAAGGERGLQRHGGRAPPPNRRWVPQIHTLLIHIARCEEVIFKLILSSICILSSHVPLLFRIMDVLWVCSWSFSLNGFKYHSLLWYSFVSCCGQKHLQNIDRNKISQINEWSFCHDVPFISLLYFFV